MFPAARSGLPSRSVSVCTVSTVRQKSCGISLPSNRPRRCNMPAMFVTCDQCGYPIDAREKMRVINSPTYGYLFFHQSPDCYSAYVKTLKQQLEEERLRVINYGLFSD